MNIGDTVKLNTNPEDSPETILRLFVYGTLKRGYWNHQRFCAQARSIEPAVVWGRLYHLHARRAQHVPAGDGGGAARAHLDCRLDLLDAMPRLRGKSRQRRVVTSVSRPLRPYPDEIV
jgi:gamma-glutamylcyclotransferase (GGCT)/AIG2-like uncharacterized protein YtfP